jgi:Protein kinase domain
MGVLWAAHDRTLGREVAVKEVRLPADQSAGLRERALREARAAARLTHPSAVTVYGVVEEDGRPWIVMELLSPRTLAAVLAEAGPMAPASAARLGLDLLDALAAAHAAGVVHRDVKPGNVLFADGRAVLVDFGIAMLDEDPAITGAGILLGSPAFMAPERARGEQPTPASDLWSLGATLFAAVEGQPPFRGEGNLSTLAAVVTQDAPPAGHAGPLRPVLAALLAREPANRPSVEQARALLLAASLGAPIVPAPVPPAHALTEPASALEVLTQQADGDTVAAHPAVGRSLLHRHRRHGALVAATFAPVAVFALAVALPMPWQHSAAPAQQPAASSRTPATTVRAQAATSPARNRSATSRSAVRTPRTTSARARTVVVSWARAPGEDKDDGHGDGHGKGQGKEDGKGHDHGGGEG